MKSRTPAKAGPRRGNDAPAQAAARQELDGPGLLEALRAGLAWVESQAEAINALNVYPVPDGDTGTNMSLTLREALGKVSASEEAASASAVAEAVAREALYAARGNSGAILSQILRGLARGFEGQERVSGGDLARAFQTASEAAYGAIPKPVEGTILTVMREVAEATRGQVAESQRTGAPGIGATAVLDLAARTARDSVARTPLLLDVLRENGVVDAGGQGLYTLLEGMAHFAAGDATPPPTPTSAPRAVSRLAGAWASRPYGFCTEFFIEGCAAGVEELRARFQSMGDSVMVIADGGHVKVHLHAPQPEPALAYGRSLGAVTRVKVDDIDEQHRQFAAKAGAAAEGLVGVVAVVSGEGMGQLFRSLGASALVEGGQTMNPSAGQILEAAMRLPHQEVLVLPNNSNVYLAARQAAVLAGGKRLHMLETDDMAQGIAAMVAFNFESDASDNLDSMREALRSVKTGAVTRAVRASKVARRSVARGQAIGLAGGTPVVAAGDPGAAVEALLAHLGVHEGAVVTLFHGVDVGAAEAESTRARAQRRFPSAEVHLVAGGQPHYHYLLSIE